MRRLDFSNQPSCVTGLSDKRKRNYISARKWERASPVEPTGPGYLSFLTSPQPPGGNGFVIHTTSGHTTTPTRKKKSLFLPLLTTIMLWETDINWKVSAASKKKTIQESWRSSHTLVRNCPRQKRKTWNGVQYWKWGPFGCRHVGANCRYRQSKGPLIG